MQRNRLAGAALVLLAVTADAQPPVPAKPRPRATSGWKTTVTRSKMDDSKTVALQLSAISTITGWPGKTVRPSLWLRCQEQQTAAYVVTGMHPAVESGNLDGATVLVRFDKDPPQALSTSKSSDGEALFFEEPIELIKTMADKKTLLFRFTPFNSSPQEMEFNLAGLSSALSPLREACGWSVAQEAQRDRDEEGRIATAIQNLLDPNPTARWQAADAIGQAKTSNRTLAIPTLVELLNDPDLAVRGSAARALGSMGPLASSAVPALEEALKDPKRANMSRALRDALDNIRNGSK